MTPRRLLVFRGARESTRADADAALAAFPAVVYGPPPLGSDAAAVVVSLHDGFDPDVVGRAVGAIHAGGVLALCLPPDGPPPWPALTVWPAGPEDVARHLPARLERSLGAWPERGPVAPGPFEPAGSSGQAAVIAALTASPPGSRSVVIGARGRGKSTAVGLAARTFPGRTVVTSLDEAHAATLRAHAGGFPWVDAADLAASGEPVDTVIVDEASAVPVPVLVRLAEAFPAARMVFATTVHGYEGTGRGFVHRFLPWLRRRGELAEHTLTEPVRWAPGDPLEAWADALLLQDVVRAAAPLAGDLRVERISGAELARDEALLRDVFGLLVDAHYRTAPSDLARLLDATNLALYAARAGGRVVGVAWQAREGGLPPAWLDRLHHGERLRGHALPETLVSHSGADEAAAMHFLRSVRLATDPAWRRRGVAAALVAHVEATNDPDAFGTVFGATAELLRFRRALGYTPVRLAASRGARSGEPAVVCAKARSPRAEALVRRLRADLARDLSAQLALAAADAGALLDPPLIAELTTDLPTPSALDPDAVGAFLRGRPYEAAVTAVEALVATADLSALPDDERRVVEGRVVGRVAWRDLAGADVPAAMRRLRRAVARLAGVTTSDGAGGRGSPQRS